MGVLTTNNFNDIDFDVEFMSCVVDKADNLKVIESDSHFSDFTGVHPSKIKQGKFLFLDTLNPKDRETVMRRLCKKGSPYVYLDFYLKNKNDEFVLVHAIAQNISNSTLTRLTLADISRSQKKGEMLKRKADSMNRLIDLVEGGVCLFKVNPNMHFEVLYMNKACAKFFGSGKDSPIGKLYRLDEFIYKDDKSAVFQAIGNSMATKKPIDMELRVVENGESFIWCKLNSAIQRYDKDGCPIFHAVFTDISKIKEAEQAADSERDIMVNIFKNLPGPLFCTDFQTPMLFDVVSKDFMRLIGYTRKELFEELGGNFKELIIGNADEIEKELLRQAKDSDIVKVNYNVKTKNGKLLNVIDRRRIVDNKINGKSMIGILKDSSATQVGDVEI